MNNFIKGVLFGVGVGLLVAPMKGDEMRKLVSERVGELRGYLPENEQLSSYKEQLSSRVSQTAGTLKGYAQQAASTVKSSADNLSTIAQNISHEVKSTGQDISDTTQDTLHNSNHAL
jgi:hypothetical protein